MNNQCRLCFRYFWDGLFHVPNVLATPSRQDPTVCTQCFSAGSDQSDAKEMSVEDRQASYLTRAHAALSPDAPTEVTPQGGKHSRTGLAFHQLPPDVMFSLARVLYEGGTKYGRDNWKSISVEDHLNHALMHIFGFLNHDTQDDHLTHAIIRLIFAATVSNEGGPYSAAN